MKSKTLACLALLLSVIAVVAQTSTFTYQGQLTANGDRANGFYDLRFTLHDAATLGGQVGNALTNTAVNVSNGVFTVLLDFGNVFDGSARWLSVGVRSNGAAVDFTVLSPRQLVTATPYAIRAANYTGTLGTTNLTGKINDTNLSVNVALTTNNVVFTRSVTASNFIGNGLGLTNLSTTNLIGTIPDARLSTNVAFVNTSNTAFLGSISATNFHGFGGGLTNVPGRIFEYVTTAANITATANFGYLAVNNSAPVVITLPPTAQITNGQTVRVTGAGNGGWIIAQNAGQVIYVGNLTENVGFLWRTNESSRSWDSVASSADGSKLVAVVSPGNIFTSTNYGVTWGQQASAMGNLNWNSVASSADGTRLVAAVNGGNIYVSANSGTNWGSPFGTATWTGVASSWNGSNLVACSGSAGIYTSVNGGASWTPRVGAASWTGVASSGNGSNLVAALQGGQIQISTNAGASWTPRGSIGSWTCVASSADGSTLVAGQNAGFVYVSLDSGLTWIPNGVSANWTSVSCS
ncbi:MAG TPA: sialidase family protein, partial [Verrucomicrobiae bacterium]|nr:sialidase family protein [Verrucomicrobiae bacterium]